MIYCADPVEEKLLRKVNRFLSLVEIGGETHKTHIPNSGRLTELMISGKRVTVSRAQNPDRKTKFTLRSVWHGGRWVCVDSQVPNALAAELAAHGRLPFAKGYTEIRREYSIGKHRFDLKLDGAGKKPMLVEVKSVTLVERGVARFPDAPTIRGRAHLEALTNHLTDGYRCAVLFIVQRSDANRFEPNRDTDPQFCEALKNAKQAGVKVDVVRCRVGRRSISYMDRLPVRLA